MAVADSYKFLSKALTINKHFKENLYYEHAQNSFRIAIENYSSECPKLLSYQISLGKLSFNVIKSSH